jgi:hypothetical protein
MKPKTLFDTATLTFRLSRASAQCFKMAGVQPVKLVYRSSNQPMLPTDVIFRKYEHGGITLTVSANAIRLVSRLAGNKIAAYSYWLDQCSGDVAELSVTISDGDLPSEAMFTPSSAGERQVAIPDPHFFNSRGLQKLRGAATTMNRDWAGRSSRIRWRGANTGLNRLQFHGMPEADPTVNARLRMAMIARELKDMDTGFVSAVWYSLDHEILRYYDLWKSPIPEIDWINDKFAIDIDGYTNTWTNFLARLHLGCCVLKVDSQFGYRQWYYDRIKPWEHFVPVKANMSDLAEKIDWVRSNDARAEEIARNGQAFARTMTFESETKAAVELITNGVRGQKSKNAN